MGSCFGSIFEECHQGPIASIELIFNPILGLCLRLVYLLFQTPSIIIFFLIKQFLFVAMTKTKGSIEIIIFIIFVTA